MEMILGVIALGVIGYVGYRLVKLFIKHDPFKLFRKDQ